MTYNYFKEVKKDVENWISENIDLTKYTGERDRLEEKLNDDLWIDDGITGNGSGSYTFDRNRAKEYVLADMDTVTEALREFCTEAETISEKFLSEDQEYFDVTARCYVLGSAIYEVLDELENESAFDKAEEAENAITSGLNDVVEGIAAALTKTPGNASQSATA